MRELWSLLAVLLLILLPTHAQTFSFTGNTTCIDDPLALLNFRHVSFSNNNVEKYAWFRSVRAQLENGTPHSEIDTLGGFVSYRTLPTGLLAYWGNDVGFTDKTFQSSTSLSIMLNAYVALIEKDMQGNLVRSYSLSQSISNVSQGADWSVSSAESDSEGNLRWLQMSTSIDDETNDSTFSVILLQFVSAVRGQINVGETELSPRMLESMIRITNYSYLNSSNSLSLRVLCGHDSTSFNAQLGIVSSGSDLSRVYFQLLNTVQHLPDADSFNGTRISASISQWQSSPGLRNAITNSIAGDIMNAKYHGDWDVRFVDVTFPAGLNHILYDSTLGTGYQFNNLTSSLEANVDDRTAPSSSSFSACACPATLTLPLLLVFLL